jgi:hypothetical protein
MKNPTKKNGLLDPNAVYADAGVVSVAAPKVAGGSGDRGKVLEKAMGDAILQALAEGISINSPIIKERMDAARKG